jgi:predicted alpha/beta hydrolase family esterase
LEAGTWLVGHSLGCITVLRHLAEQRTPWVLGGLIFVAGFTGRLSALPVLDPILERDVEVDLVPSRVKKIVCIRSNDDPIVPASQSDDFANRLGVRSVVIDGAAHFLDANGVVELPVVAEVLGLSVSSSTPGRCSAVGASPTEVAAVVD